MAVYTKRSRLPGGHVVDFIYDTSIQRLDFLWTPHLPERRTRKFMKLYREARNAFLQHVAAQENVAVAVLDTPDVVSEGGAHVR